LGLFLSPINQQDTIKKEIFTTLTHSSSNQFEINFSKRERFSIKPRLPDLVRRQDIALSSQILPNQKVEPYTILATLNNIGKFYRIQYSTKYENHLKAFFDQEVIDTLEILNAGFSKSEIE
jgi:hypothetical protein